MTKILALDTATEACSVALLLDDEIIEEFQIAPRQHAQRILPLIEKLLKKADLKLTDLDALAFGRGPGSFMGLRLAASVIQGLAFGAQLPIISISSLQALAEEALDKSDASSVLAGWDARMNAIYWNVFSNQLQPQFAQDQLSDPKAIPLDAAVAAGNAWSVYADQLAGKIKIIEACYPRASCVAKLALTKFHKQEFTPLCEALPNYLRDKVVYTHPT